MNYRLLAVCILLIAAWSDISAQDDLKAFPAAEPGMNRFVWRLPARSNEGELKVEIMAGKNVEVDSVNRHSLSGTIEEETIQGWGYTRYVVNSDGAVISTLVGVPPDRPRITKFVRIGGTKLYRYNSRLPIVVYAPKGLTVKFRIWSAGAETVEAKIG